MSARGFASHSESWPSALHRVLLVQARMHMLPGAASRQPIVLLVFTMMDRKPSILLDGQWRAICYNSFTLAVANVCHTHAEPHDPGMLSLPEVLVHRAGYSEGKGR